MARLDPIITSFVGGEFGASLHGRSDIAQYYAAAETVENFFIKPSGPAISSPGTQYVATVKDSSKQTRLLEFIFNRDDAYVIEFGDSYFRFYAQQGVVVTTGTTAYELAHTFTEDELFDVQFAQLNDVIYLTHPDHNPQKLTRVSSNNWTLADLTFLGGPFSDDNTSAVTLTVSDSSGTINVTASSALFTVSGSTLGHQDTYWKLGSTSTDATTGLAIQGYIQVDDVISTTVLTASVINNLTVTGATTSWAEGAWSDIRGYPARVVFHESRLFMARTDYEPQKIWGSQSYVYDDFLIGALDDDALNIQIASDEANEIQWLASTNDLVVGTYGGEFRIFSGSASEPLTPTNVNSKKQTSWGSEAVRPVKAGSFVYYVQRFGKKLRELYYSWDLDGYKSIDKTILNPEVLGDGCIDMAFQQNPYPAIYCVKTGGGIGVFVREVDQEVQAWSNIASEDGDGKFKSIAVIPSYYDDYDEVWAIVERTVNGSTVQYVEFFKNVDSPARQDMNFYVHSGLSYSAYEDTSSSTVNVSLSNTAGAITLTCSTAYFAAGDVGNRIRAIDSDGVTLGECKISSYTSTTIVNATVVDTFSTTAYTANYWGISVTDVTGLDHLEAKAVTVLADGGVDKPNETVSGGSITLNYNYFVIHAGLGYDQILYTLPIESQTSTGTAQGKLQRIHNISFRVNNSYQGFETGGDADSLDQIQFRDPTTLMGSPEGLYTGVIPNIPFKGNYEYGSQVMIKNSDPLPVEILSIMPQMTIEAK